MLKIKKVSIIFALILTITGCQEPSIHSVPANEHNQENNSLILDSVVVIFKEIEVVKFLEIADDTEIGEVIHTEEVNNTEIKIYRAGSDKDILKASIFIGQSSYNIGEIGYGNIENFKIEVVDVLDSTYIKFSGATGANSPVAYYILPDLEAPLVLHIDGHTVEADVNQDGVIDIISTVGTAANTTVYTLLNKKVMASNLNEITNAQVVLYDPKTNHFQIQTSNNKLTEWRFQANKLQSVR